LIQLQEQHGNKWAQIAKSFTKRRSDVILRMHALKMQESMQRPWSRVEDEELLTALEVKQTRDVKEIDWMSVSDLMGAFRMQRFPCECRARYRELVRGDRKRLDYM
jgi:hypothetical protein